MNYSNGDTSQGLRSFVSESELEEKRKRRQEEWDRVRTDDQPLEAPEEEYDSRTLYERLKQQKDKKQEEFEESKKLKHLIKGLDNDELSFLEMVDNNKLQIETQRWKEEVSAIEEYKRAVIHLNSEEQEKRLNEFKNQMINKSSNKSFFSNVNNPNKTPKKSSQSALLANVVRKRSQSENSDDKSAKKSKNESTDDINDTKNDNKSHASVESETHVKRSETVKCIGVLPGLGHYASSDSSDSDNSSNSASEMEVLNNFKLIVRRKRVTTQESKSETTQSQPSVQ